MKMEEVGVVRDTGDLIKKKKSSPLCRKHNLAAGRMTAY